MFPLFWPNWSNDTLAGAMQFVAVRINNCKETKIDRLTKQIDDIFSYHFFLNLLTLAFPINQKISQKKGKILDNIGDFLLNEI